MNKILIFGIILILQGCVSGIKAPSTCSDIASCANLVKLKLQSNLILEKSFKGQYVLIEFFLDDNGNVVKDIISSSSGISELEMAAKKAVYASSPFKELLALTNKDYIEFKHVRLTIEPYE
jgi:membrane protein involved in colicin uptake